MAAGQRGSDFVLGPDPLQVTGAGALGKAGIYLAKFIQTEQEPDPREGVRTCGGT